MRSGAESRPPKGFLVLCAARLPLSPCVDLLIYIYIYIYVCDWGDKHIACPPSPSAGVCPLPPWFRHLFLSLSLSLCVCVVVYVYEKLAKVPARPPTVNANLPINAQHCRPIYLTYHVSPIPLSFDCFQPEIAVTDTPQYAETNRAKDNRFRCLCFSLSTR